jgi:hypothetical protein
MSQPFKREAYDYVWGSLGSDRKQAVRDKARWEHVPLAAALRWMEPELWSEVLELSEACP